MRFDFKAQRILDFDIEARPLSWIGGDYVSREVTAIAAGFDPDSIDVAAIYKNNPGESRGMLAWFKRMYDSADIVTGHYIRKYDLPNINSACMDFGLTPLGPKLVSDTKQDLVKLDGVSCSQESLAAMLGISQPKEHMTQQDWRQANRLIRVDRTIERVMQDVRQHMELRAALVKGRYLGTPRMWYPEVRY